MWIDQYNTSNVTVVRSISGFANMQPYLRYIGVNYRIFHYMNLSSVVHIHYTFFTVSEISPLFFFFQSFTPSSFLPPLPSVLLFPSPSPVCGWQLLGAVVRQSRVFVCQHWSHCSRCVCVCSPTRLHMLVPIEARLADCRMCVCLCVWVDRVRQTRWLSVSSYWWMKRWVWFLRRPGQPLEQTILSPWPWRSFTHLSLFNPCN